MSTPDIKAYPDIDRAKFNKMKEMLARNEIIPPNGDQGTVVIRKYNITLEANFQETSRVLNLRIRNHPFYISNDKIWEKLDALIKDLDNANSVSVNK